MKNCSKDRSGNCSPNLQEEIFDTENKSPAWFDRSNHAGKLNWDTRPGT